MVNSSNPAKDRVTIRSRYSIHEASRKSNHRRSTLPSATFTDEIFRHLHSGRRAHQQERLPPIYLLVEASSKNNFTRADLRSDAEIRVAAGVTLFLHAPPPVGASAVDKPIHPLHALRCRQKSPSFSVFLFGHCYFVFLSPEYPLFLCFLELYDIFRTLGVLSVASY